MEHVIPVILATEVYYCLEWAEVLRVCGVSATVLHLLKQSVRQASGRLGYHRIRLHPTLVHNVYKLWRRTICVLEAALDGCAQAHGGIWWSLETRQDRLFAPRGQRVLPRNREPVLLTSPLVAFMDLILAWRLDIWLTHQRCRIRGGYVILQMWELTGAAQGLPLFAEVRKHRVLAPPRPLTPILISDDEESAESEGAESVEVL